MNHYEEEGLDGLLDNRLSQASHRKAPVDEVLALVNQRVAMRNVISEARLERTHFHTWYRRDGGTRSYSFRQELSFSESGFVVKAS
jgi:hypothetical protein